MKFNIKECLEEIHKSNNQIKVVIRDDGFKGKITEVGDDYFALRTIIDDIYIPFNAIIWFKEMTK